MGAADALALLRTAGLTIRAEGGRLVVGPAEQLTDALRDVIRANKPGLLAAVLCAQGGAGFEPRAPILRFTCWLIVVSDAEPLLVVTNPPATVDWMLARYPDATKVKSVDVSAAPTAVPITQRLYERPLAEWTTDAAEAEAADFRRMQANAAAAGLDALASDSAAEAVEIEAMVRDRRTAAAPPIPACSTCRSATRYGNCGRPVEAGICDEFALTRHPSGGMGCTAYEGGKA